jgi:hypothetical protein
VLTPYPSKIKGEDRPKSELSLVFSRTSISHDRSLKDRLCPTAVRPKTRLKLDLDGLSLQFYKDTTRTSVILTSLRVMLASCVLFWHFACDFHTHACDLNTHACDFETHEG